MPLTATLVRTRAVPDPGPLVGRLPGAGGLAWVRRGDGLVAWGEAARLEVSGPDRFAEAARWWREVCATILVDDPVGLPGTGAVALGSFAFGDDDGTRSVLVLPRVVLGRRGGRAWLTTVGDAPEADAVPEPVAAPVGVVYGEGAVSPVRYEEAVAEAVRLIAASPLEKVVLARDLLAVAEQPVDPRWLLGRLATRYPACWTFAVDGLVGATPELLVRLERGLVTSRVLAGTIRRTGDDDRDLVLAASLARSSKDLEEHEYAVRSVADALAPHCTGMNVPETPFVLHLPNVMHLATDVAAVAADRSSSLELAAALHPTAAVCGTPRDLALAAIDRLEGLDRGRYAGPVGWVDATGAGEWGIALRSAALDPDDPRRLTLYAGCGIVAGSDPEAELAESQAKLVPMRDALGA
ncbi:isochorismate synthase [Vallicoccus soli]|uniref:isochorismate synthase n=1 Tax=Vallicoccus soli TaxID=2339232 RepID=UPI003CCC67AA